MATKPKITDPKTASLNDKLKYAGTKVRYYKEKTRTANDLGKNANGSWTSNGSLNQGYDSKSKQFTKTTSSSARGRMAEEGSTRAGGKTHTMSYKDANGERHSGRSGQLASRRQRYYDVRVGLGMVGG